MNIFRSEPKEITVGSMSASCKIGDVYIQCSIGEISSTNMICSFHTGRMHSSMMDFLNKCVAISIENMIIEGTLCWYTVEESYYRICIAISTKDRNTWRRLVAAKNRALVQQSAKTASI